MAVVDAHSDPLRGSGDDGHEHSDDRVAVAARPSKVTLKTTAVNAQSDPLRSGDDRAHYPTSAQLPGVSVKTLHNPDVSGCRYTMKRWLKWCLESGSLLLISYIVSLCTLYSRAFTGHVPEFDYHDPRIRSAGYAQFAVDSILTILAIAYFVVFPEMRHKNQFHLTGALVPVSILLLFGMNFFLGLSYEDYLQLIIDIGYFGLWLMWNAIIPNEEITHEHQSTNKENKNDKEKGKREDANPNSYFYILGIAAFFLHILFFVTIMVFAGVEHNKEDSAHFLKSLMEEIVLFGFLQLIIHQLGIKFLMGEQPYSQHHHHPSQKASRRSSCRRPSLFEVPLSPFWKHVVEILPFIIFYGSEYLTLTMRKNFDYSNNGIFAWGCAQLSINASLILVCALWALPERLPSPFLILIGVALIVVDIINATTIEDSHHIISFIIDACGYSALYCIWEMKRDCKWIQYFGLACHCGFLGLIIYLSASHIEESAGAFFSFLFEEILLFEFLHIICVRVVSSLDFNRRKTEMELTVMRKKSAGLMADHNGHTTTSTTSTTLTISPTPTIPSTTTTPPTLNDSIPPYEKSISDLPVVATELWVLFFYISELVTLYGRAFSGTVPIFDYTNHKAQALAITQLAINVLILVIHLYLYQYLFPWRNISHAYDQWKKTNDLQERTTQILGLISLIFVVIMDVILADEIPAETIQIFIDITTFVDIYLLWRIYTHNPQNNLEAKIKVQKRRRRMIMSLGGQVLFFVTILVFNGSVVQKAKVNAVYFLITLAKEIALFMSLRWIFQRLELNQYLPDNSDFSNENELHQLEQSHEASDHHSDKLNSHQNDNNQSHDDNRSHHPSHIHNNRSTMATTAQGGQTGQTAVTVVEGAQKAPDYYVVFWLLGLYATLLFSLNASHGYDYHIDVVFAFACFQMLFNADRFLMGQFGWLNSFSPSPIMLIFGISLIISDIAYAVYDTSPRYIVLFLLDTFGYLTMYTLWTVQLNEFWRAWRLLLCVPCHFAFTITVIIYSSKEAHHTSIGHFQYLFEEILLVEFLHIIAEDVDDLWDRTEKRQKENEADSERTTRPWVWFCRYLWFFLCNFSPTASPSAPSAPSVSAPAVTSAFTISISTSTSSANAVTDSDSDSGFNSSNPGPGYREGKQPDARPLTPQSDHGTFTLSPLSSSPLQSPSVLSPTSASAAPSFLSQEEDGEDGSGEGEISDSVSNSVTTLTSSASSVTSASSATPASPDDAPLG